jgi:hypothetical protein
MAVMFCFTPKSGHRRSEYRCPFLCRWETLVKAGIRTHYGVSPYIAFS